MPWKECQPMDERLRFVARLLDGEKMARLCAELGSPARPATDLRSLRNTLISYAPKRRTASIEETLHAQGQGERHHDQLRAARLG